MSESGSATPAPASAKRPRPVISCLECRRKKLKCSRTYPCQQCVKIGRPARCEFQAGQEPEPNLEYGATYDPPHKRQRIIPPPSWELIEATQSPQQVNGQAHMASKQGIIEDLQERVTRLERALTDQIQQSASIVARKTNAESRIDGSVHTQLPSCSDGSIHISTQFSEACLFMDRLQQKAAIGEILALKTDLEHLNYSVESNHRDDKPQALPAFANGSYSVRLPPQDICEKLGLLYFDNLEHCFRILHRAHFREQLNILFDHGEHACAPGFMPQLLGALAIAVRLSTHPECEAAATYPSIDPASAISHMEKYLQRLRSADRYCVSALQVKMLLLFCKWLYAEAFDELLQLSGGILRDALVMKMDQDPSQLKDIDVFEGELRRRAWMTIVETELMLSILCKMPCMVPPYTSLPPRNINDDDISDGMEDLPPSKSTTEWTDSLCQYFLAQTFSRRLAAYSEPYKIGKAANEDIFPHILYLEQKLQELPPPLRFNYLGDTASQTPARLMARMELDISIRRPLMHLYLRGVLSSAGENVRRELLAGFLQSCLMLVNYQDLFDPRYSELDVPKPQGYWDFFYSCYRLELGQATLGLCLVVRSLGLCAQINDMTITTASILPGIPNNTNMKGPSYTKENLIGTIKDTLEPMRRRLPYRASHMKDLVYYEIILTSLLPKQPESQSESAFVQRLQDLVRECRDELDRAHVVPRGAPQYVLKSRTTDKAIYKHMNNFDPLWEGFPRVDILEPFDHYQA